MKRVSYVAAVAAVGLSAGLSNAATLLYQYDFDNGTASSNSTTTGATVSSETGTSTGGVLTSSNTANYGSVGPSGLSTDHAYGVSSASTYGSTDRAQGTISTTTVPDVSSNQITVTAWVQLTAAADQASNFNRIVVVSPVIGAGTVNGGAIYLALNSGGLQANMGDVSGNGNATGNPNLKFAQVGATTNGYNITTKKLYTSPTTADTSWHFIAVTFDGTNTGANPTADDGTSTNGNLGNLIYYTGTTSTAATAFEYDDIQGATIPSLAGATIDIGNAFGSSREFPGNIDDVRVYSGVLSAAQIDAVQASAVPEPASLGLLSLSGLSLLRRRRA